METGLPRKKRSNRKVSPELKVSDILSFTSAIIAVLASAIFYFAGWVYVSHWYSFFGIDATATNEPTQVILIHGVPGILIIVLTGFIAGSVFAIIKFSRNASFITTDDFPLIVLFTYYASIIVLATVLILAYQHLNIWLFSVEVKISIFMVLFLTVSLTIINELDLLAAELPIYNLVFGSIKPARLISWLRMISEPSSSNDSGQFLRLFFLQDEAYKKDLDQREQELLEQVKKQKVAITNAATQTWQFWVGAIIILYFLISISASSIFGEWDAREGRKSMVGGWRAEATYIYSKHDIVLPLPLDPTKSSTELNVYGPLFIIGKNGDTYYLTNWLDEFPYTEKPNVYVTQLTENTSLGIQIFSSTPIPTLTPYVVETPTQSPVVTVTGTSTP